MIVSTPEYVLLKLLWDVREANGRPPSVAPRELAACLHAMQQAGAVVYAAREVEDLESALGRDLAELESRGFVRWRSAGDTELTPYGDLVASALEYPDWMRDSARAGIHGGFAENS
jgi:hypothetical protein